MNMNRTIPLLILFASAVFPSLTSAARWQNGPENGVHCKQYGATESIAIGDGENRTWFWSEGWGVSFSPGQQMPDYQDCAELSCGKTIGEQALFAFTFRFDKPITQFRFTTPLLTGVDLNTGDIIVQYAVGEKGEYQEWYRFSKTSEGYQPGGSFPPKQLDWVKLNPPERLLRIRFLLVGHATNIPFHAGKDDGAVLEYTTAVLPPEEMVSVKLIPDGSQRAYLYTLDESLRAIVDVGATKLPEPPQIEIYDDQRGISVKTVPTESLGSLYRADITNLPAGCYELRVLLPLVEGTKSVPAGKFILLHQPRQLTRDQERHSAFGMNDEISYPACVQGSRVIPSGQEIVKRIGVHQMRGGTPTWITACPAPGVFNIPDRETFTAITEDDMKYGLVRRNSLAFTPGWALDIEKIKKKGEIPSLLYPCKKEHLKDYAEYCRRLATATKGLLESDFEYWNEPNSIPYGCFKGTFEEFAEICRTGADAIHSVNPDARMCIGQTGGADVGFIVQLFKAGMDKRAAIVDVHPYRQTDQGPEDGLLADIRRLQLAIERYGNHQAIMFSEIGWPTHLPVGSQVGCYKSVSHYQQACYVARTMFISIAAGVERVHFHQLKDWGGNSGDPENNFGFVTLSGQPKPSLSALATTSRHLEAAKFLGVMKNTPEFHHVWAWKPAWQKGAVLLTVWADTAMLQGKAPKWIKLPGKCILAEDLWGGPISPKRLRKTDDGWFVQPGEDPLFIYLPAKSVTGRLAPLPKVMRPQHLKSIEAVRLQDQSPRIDGELAEWGELPGTITEEGGNSSKGMGWAGVEEKFEQGQTGTTKFGVRYDDKGLYIAAQVYDPDGMKNDKSHWWLWAGDCVRLYMSTMDTTDTPYYTEDHFQFIASPESTNQGPAQVAHISASTPRGVKIGDLIPGAEVQAKPVKDGWVLEAFIPWDYFGKTPKPGDIWSFDIEAGGHIWNGTCTNWNNPTVWGRLKFTTPIASSQPSE